MSIENSHIYQYHQQALNSFFMIQAQIDYKFDRYIHVMNIIKLKWVPVIYQRRGGLLATFSLYVGIPICLYQSCRMMLA